MAQLSYIRFEFEKSAYTASGLRIKQVNTWSAIFS